MVLEMNEMSLTLPQLEIEPCPAQLSPQHIEQYRRDGFIAFREVLSLGEVEKAKQALSALVDKLRGQHRTLRNSYGTLWVDENSLLKIQFQRGYEPHDDNDPDATNKVRKFHDLVGAHPHLTFLAQEQDRIQTVLAGLIGEQPILSQNMALVNPPRLGTGKPWHQDDAYFSVVPLEAVCGVWIALDEAGRDNGCMNFLAGWHRKGPLRHYHGSDCEIVPERLTDEAAVAVPLPPGGAVFFCGVAPHMTKPNGSDQRRRALQFHYRSRDSRIVSREEYDTVFAEADGSPASCAAAVKHGL